MTVINMECRAGMMTMPENSVDAIVTDPPYGLSKEPDMAEVLRHWLAGDDYDHGGGGFMGKSWDSFVPGPATWREALRVLKPGGHALVFAGSRTQDLMTTSLRLAGFEIRDAAMWLYGSGFPKSLNVGKQLPEWEGYGTALKPAYEPIIIARKPLTETIVKTVAKHGTGALNINGCRVEGKRWPANILHDGSDEVVELFPSKAGAAAPVKSNEPSAASTGNVTGKRNRVEGAFHNDKGSAARFFYCAKTSKADRDAGLENFEIKQPHEITGRKEGSAGQDNPRASTRAGERANYHTTVKPTDLMRWCCRLIGHPGAMILDPFAGSGSTGRGAVLEGFEFIGFQWDPEDPEGHMVDIANARINNAYNVRNKDND